MLTITGILLQLIDGTWVVIRQDNLPNVIRKNRVEDIRRARDFESRSNSSQDDRGHLGNIIDSENLNNTDSYGTDYPV